MEELKPNTHYTYADYMSWDDSDRFELIDGDAYMMAPPRRLHQEVSGEFFVRLHSFLKDKPCSVFHAPFGVRLDPGGIDDSVVLPDITIVCDKSKLDEHGCSGAPDFIIEILSPSTAGYDLVVKFNKYLQSGVREYWIVDPDSKTVTAHTLKDGQYVTNAYGETDTISVRVLDGCEINLKEVFTER